MVGRPEYSYIAVARAGRPHLPLGGRLCFPAEGPALAVAWMSDQEWPAIGIGVQVQAYRRHPPDAWLACVVAGISLAFPVG
jgi:hypothetical protein